MVPIRCYAKDADEAAAFKATAAANRVVFEAERDAADAQAADARLAAQLAAEDAPAPPPLFGPEDFPARAHTVRHARLD